MVRFISMMEFIQNIDALVVILWILSVFVHLSLNFFIASYGTAQWLGVKNWRIIIWFIIPFEFLFATTWLPRVTVHTDDVKIWAYFVFPISMIGVPLLLWIVGTLRKK
ncbi:hypothetical protein LSG31_01660 [Fodinisporobacter ferrooxydans]|uniref:Uncharacterized protein n=2 Tax=Fodinisporobacter ferrooxydans TaxID=2901836 RepID=A0ABY4CR39_9BACL|nr:hypothetical protein LSG31_01660 [Alicyclobacillaceae bacterium MYW30-H2]